MRSDSGLFARCLLSLTVGLTVVPSRAHATDTLRLVLRIWSDAERQLLPRLRGQLSDVDATLIVAETAPLEAKLANQLEVARALATLHGADVIVWCARAADATPPQHWLVQVVLPRADRILTRQLSGATHDMLSSSELETAAVLIRSALLAKAQGIEVGEPIPNVVLEAAPPDPRPQGAEADATVSRPTTPSFDHEALRRNAVPSGQAADALRAPGDVADEGPHPPPTEPSTAADSSEQTARPLPLAAAGRADAPHALDRSEPENHPGLERATPRARLSLGAQLALDGQSSSGQRGLYARAGLSVGAWAVYAFGALSLASDIEDSSFTLRVARHALAVMLERQLPLSETLSLGLAVQAGALLLRRTSQAERPGAVSYPASLTAAFVFGPELAFVWKPASFGLSVRVGLDYLPNAPRFETSGITPDRSRVSHALWSVEPRIALGLETALP